MNQKVQMSTSHMSNISYRHINPYFAHYTKQKFNICAQRKMRGRSWKPTALVFDEVVCAITSKVISNTLTYPLESVRLISLCDEETKKDKSRLFFGVNTYLPYCIFGSIMTYKIYFYCLCVFTACTTHNNAILIASSITSIITAQYKIPYGYMLKNAILRQHVSFKGLYNFAYYSKAFLATIMEDIPEMYIKFVMSWVFETHMPLCNSIVSSVGIAVVSSLVICPMEFLKTTILCSTKKMTLTFEAIFIRLLTNIINTFLFFWSFNTLRQTFIII